MKPKTNLFLSVLLVSLCICIAVLEYRQMYSAPQCLEPRKRVALFTLRTGVEPWAKIAIQNKQLYAKKMGYGLYIDHGITHHRQPVWSKLSSLRMVINHEWKLQGGMVVG